MDDHGSYAADAGAPAIKRNEGNALLSALGDTERAALLPHLELVPFRNGDMIARAGDPAESLCFPMTGIAAVLDSLEGDRRYAVALVGSEGFVRLAAAPRR